MTFKPLAALALAAVLPLCAIQTFAQITPPGATRALYTFHRDDTAAVTRITIDARHTGATPLSPYVSGNFIEHLFQVVDATLGADPLINPNLERDTPQQTEPPYWDDAGDATWKEDGGYQSLAYLRLSAPEGTLSQRLYMPIQRERFYTLTFFTRGRGQIAAVLHGGDALTSPAVTQTPFSVSSANWQKQTVGWFIPDGVVAVGQQLRFAITHTGGGPVDVDWVQLMPDDAVDGMDPEVVALAKAWDIPLLRLAGNFSSQYDWRDGVGPLYSRPTRHNAAWGGPESNQFGTDEFLDLARRIGAVPQIAANAGNGTPDEAAAWVRYCNAKTEQVPIWEIGNELYGGWQIGHTDPAGYAARFVAFRDAMRKADPKIQIIATGNNDDSNWNTAALSAAVANGGQAPDWLSCHPLVNLPGGMGNTPYADEWQSTMAHPAYMDQTEFPNIEHQIVSVEGPNPRTRIAPTEWGIIIVGNNGDDWRNGPNHNVEAGCIYNALALNTFFRNGDWVTLANVTALLHGGCIAKDHGVVFVMPEYYTDQLYALAAPRIPIQTDWTGPAADVPARGGLPGASSVPDVDVFSALTQDRRKLVVFAVNRSLNDAKPVSWNITGFPAHHVAATLLTSADPQTANTWDQPNAVHPQPFPLPGGPVASETVTLPPHALVVLTFTR